MSVLMPTSSRRFVAWARSSTRPASGTPSSPSPTIPSGCAGPTHSKSIRICPPAQHRPARHRPAPATGPVHREGAKMPHVSSPRTEAHLTSLPRRLIWSHGQAHHRDQRENPHRPICAARPTLSGRGCRPRQECPGPGIPGRNASREGNRPAQGPSALPWSQAAGLGFARQSLLVPRPLPAPSSRP